MLQVVRSSQFDLRRKRFQLGGRSFWGIRSIERDRRKQERATNAGAKGRKHGIIPASRKVWVGQANVAARRSVGRKDLIASWTCNWIYPARKNEKCQGILTIAGQSNE